MEEEIDLRQYVEVLIRHWGWIAGLALVAAAAALGVSFLIPPTYEATALVAVTEPRYVMRFDPRFETVNSVQPAYQAYLDPLLMEGLGLPVDHLPQKLEKPPHFPPGAAPVLRGKGIQGEVFDLMAKEGLNDPADVVRPRPVTLQPGQAMLPGPAAIAIHDDGHMLGKFGQLFLFHSYYL